MTPLQLAGALSIPFLIAHYFIVKKERKKLKIILWIVIILKLFVALTMGGPDMYWFTSFIQKFLSNPSENPWIYSYQHINADFPYPPLLLYIHTFFMWIFKPFLNLNPPYYPTPYSFSILRIPFLITDLIFLKIFLNLRANSKYKAAFFFYLLNPVFLYQQYYEGQIDWVALLPFVFAIYEYEKNLVSKKFLGWLSLSLMLKPLALLLMPVIFVDIIQKYKKTPIKIIKYSLLLTIPIILWKISELPFSLSIEYQSEFGAGAFNKIFGKNHLFPLPLFAIAYSIIGIYWLINSLKNTNWTIPERIIIVLLLFASLGHPARTWLLWTTPFIVILEFKGKLKLLSLFWLWTTAHLGRTLLNKTSSIPIAFSVLVIYFLNQDYAISLGGIFNSLKEIFGEQTTILIGYGTGLIFRLTGLLIIYKIFRSKWKEKSLSQ
ncbi:MAG: hypothetical protein O3B47_03095 [bacterium]|nr:hypothetical protein [bacterium]